MFDEMPDQFYQFLAARAGTTAASHHHPSAAASLSFSLHHTHHHGSSFTPTFDPSSYSLSPPPPPPPQQGLFLSPPPPPITHVLHHPQLAPHPPLHLRLKNEDKEEALLPNPNPHLHPIDHSWSNDEVLALLRIRSSLDNNWFPDFIWENVSRKLGELGFKRSAEKCKEKFEEETRSFNNNTAINAHSNDNSCSAKNNNITPSIQNYRLFDELEDLYNNHHQQQCRAPRADECDGHDQLPLILSERNPSPSRQLDEDDQAGEEDDKLEEAGEEERDTGNDDKVVVVVGEEEEVSVDDSEKTEENTRRLMIRKRKRRQHKFEMFKGFCENIVNKMMAQQEELHCKILQDMVKRDDREEAWKRREIERIQKDMEVRVHELAIVGDRQAKILSFLNNFTSSSSSFSLESQSLIEAIDNLLKVQIYISSSTTTSSVDLTQDSMISAQPTSSCTTHDQNPSLLVPTSPSNDNLAFQIPNRVETSKLALSQNPNENNSFPSIPIDKSSGSTHDHTSTDAVDHSTVDYRPSENQNQPKPRAKPSTEDSTKDDIGRRWPRDEVLALINMRCNLLSNGTDGDGLSTHHESKGHQSSIPKGIPLWERISQRMTEMGYKRNAKRCKEKWENINKYFRKTKDLNKKRSIDSRTCPYFHQLSHLYSQTQGDQGTLLLGTSDPQVVSQLPPVGSPENRPTVAQGGSCATTTTTTTTTTVQGTTAQGDNDQGLTVVHVPAALGFEF